MEGSGIGLLKLGCLISRIVSKGRGKPSEAFGQNNQPRSRNVHMGPLVYEVGVLT